MKTIKPQHLKSKRAILGTAFSILLNLVSAQEVNLHVNPRWKECSFQLDPSLTQQEWHDFTREAGMVACFRPLNSAQPLGKGRIEISLLQCKTGIDETKGAWNNTFVHPTADHYLVGGPQLSIPGITLKAGLSKKIDAGIYYTTSPGANYSFAGGQLQFNMLNASKHMVDLSSRLGFNTIYGPDDVNLAVYALDVIVSKKFTLINNWLSLSPYAGGSVYNTRAHEKSVLVNLHDESITNLQAMLGVVAMIHHFSLGVEYNKSVVNTLSFRLGYNVKVWTPKPNAL